MKKLLSFLTVILLSGALFAQQLQVNPKGNLKVKQNVNQLKTTVATLTYSGDNTGNNVGYGSAAVLTAIAYFPASTMATYNGNKINKIIIGVDPSNLSGLEVKIWTDTSNFGANPAYSQSVDLSTLSAGWNTIILNTPFDIDGSALFIGYTANSNDFGLLIDDQPAESNGYGDIIGDGTSWAHLSDYGSTFTHNWQIKAVVDDGSGSTDVACTNIVVPNPQCNLTNNEQVTVTVKNNSTSDITNAFDLNYTINGGSVSTVAVPVPLAVGASVDVSFNVDMSVDTVYDIVAYVAYNNDEDITNDTIEGVTVNTIPSAIPYSVQFDPTTGDFIGWFSEDVNNDGSTWGIYDLTSVGGGHGDTYGVAYIYNSSNNADDYMISNCMDLQASKTYRLTFWYRARSDAYPEKMKVMLGDAPTSTSMNTEIVDLGTITDTVWTQSTSTFTVPSDGTYNLGFYAYSDADQWILFFDDVTVEEVTTGVNDVDNLAVSVFPTQTNGKVLFGGVKNATVEVYDVTGNKVAEFHNVTRNINIANLNNGIYILKVSDNGKVLNKKIVLQK